VLNSKFGLSRNAHSLSWESFPS